MKSRDKKRVKQACGSKMRGILLSNNRGRANLVLIVRLGINRRNEERRVGSL